MTGVEILRGIYRRVMGHDWNAAPKGAKTRWMTYMQQRVHIHKAAPFELVQGVRVPNTLLKIELEEHPDFSIPANSWPKRVLLERRRRMVPEPRYGVFTVDVDSGTIKGRVLYFSVTCDRGHKYTRRAEKLACTLTCGRCVAQAHVQAKESTYAELIGTRIGSLVCTGVRHIQTTWAQHRVKRFVVDTTCDCGSTSERRAHVWKRELEAAQRGAAPIARMCKKCTGIQYLTRTRRDDVAWTEHRCGG